MLAQDVELESTIPPIIGNLQNYNSFQVPCFQKLQPQNYPRTRNSYLDLISNPDILPLNVQHVCPANLRLLGHF